MTNNNCNSDLIQTIILELQEDLETLEDLPQNDSKIEFDIFADFRTLYGYMAKESDPKSAHINKLFHKINTLQNKDISETGSAKELRNLCENNLFAQIGSATPPTLRSLTGWDTDKIKKDHASGIEQLTKKYILLCIELNKYFARDSQAAYQSENVLKMLTNDSQINKLLRVSGTILGFFKDSDHNASLTYHDYYSALRCAPESPANNEIDEAPHTSFLKQRVIEERKKELTNLVGLENAKDMLDSFFAQVLAFGILKERHGVETPQTVPHLTFDGNPGTGKTTLGKITADLLWAYGALPERKFQRITRADLVGQYIGHTEAKTKRTLENGVGGVIFIDEAHNLWASREENPKDFVHEVMGELVNFLEENKNECVVILAGYAKGINRLLSMDDGLQSRFQIKVHLDDYDRDELKEIFNIKAAYYGISLEDSTLIEKALDFLEKKKSILKETFANGREVRNLVENFQRAAHVRLYKAGKIPAPQEIDGGSPYASLDELQTITAEDVDKVLSLETSRMDHSKKPYGFAI